MIDIIFDNMNHMLHQVHLNVSHGPAQKIGQESSLPVQAIVPVCMLSKMNICPHHCDLIHLISGA